MPSDRRWASSRAATSDSIPEPDTVASLYQREPLTFVGRVNVFASRTPSGNTETEDVGHIARALFPSARRSICAPQIGIKADLQPLATDIASRRPRIDAIRRHVASPKPGAVPPDCLRPVSPGRDRLMFNFEASPGASFGDDLVASGMITTCAPGRTT